MHADLNIASSEGESSVAVASPVVYSIARRRTRVSQFPGSKTQGCACPLIWGLHLLECVNSFVGVVLAGRVSAQCPRMRAYLVFGASPDAGEKNSTTCLV